MNLLSLDTIVVKPDSGERPKNAVVLLHGYGGSGKDISVLANYWKRFLPSTIFLCPNGPEECSINPLGYQWFDLSEQREDSIIKKSIPNGETSGLCQFCKYQTKCLNDGNGIKQNPLSTPKRKEGDK